MGTYSIHAHTRTSPTRTGGKLPKTRDNILTGFFGNESMTFAEKLKYERELRGWSQAKMAEELATTPNRISTWERGIALPSAYFRAKLCSLLGANAQELGLIQTDRTTIDSSNSADAALPSSPALPLSNVEDARLLTKKRSLLHSRRSLYLYGSLVLITILLCSIYVTTNLHAASTNPYPPYMGHLTLNDPLDDQSSGLNWQEGTNDVQARCLFKNGAYTAYQPLAGFFHACIAQHSNYANFTYEVEMTIHTGDFAGIVFRSEDSIDSQFYLFRVHTDGSYWLFRFTDRSIKDAIVLDEGSSPSFRKDPGQSNLIAVTAQNNVLTLYINRQSVSSVHDAGYAYGQIGVLAGSLKRAPAEASFKNAKVWA